MNKKQIVLPLVLALHPIPGLSQENESIIENFWETLKSESTELVEKSIQITSKLMTEMHVALDKELDYLNEFNAEPPEVNIREKIDQIRLRVEDISQLKRKEMKASSFTLISKSKKDYRIAIDEVLNEIEPVLFDGEVVNYASKIRNARYQIKQLNQKKVALNEDLYFASETGTWLKASKEDINAEIDRIDELVRKSKKLIDALEFDLKKKMHELGIQLTRAQIRVITTRVDGDNLARSFAIFDVTKQISNTLANLVTENSFSAETTVKYYGTYVILSEILGYSQREYINQIEDLYLPSISQIEKDIRDSIEFTKDSMSNVTSDSNLEILKTNLRSNQFSLTVVNHYEEILRKQIETLETALQKTNEQIAVAYSTYDTAANSANLISLISETQDTFNRIMNSQIPDIIPFENTELELKFQEISNQIANATEA